MNHALPARAMTAAAMLALAVGGCGSEGNDRPAPSVTTRPADFTTNVDNPWFPLRPGTTLVYKGVKDGKPTRDVFAVSFRTRMIDGVPCVVVDDRSYAEGRVVERTSDYYTQHRNGDVWYFGEDTAEFDSKGKVASREGTWHAGVDGAKPGLFMPAHPRVGEHHRQEFYKGHAEDQFRVVTLNAAITVPFGSFRNALETREWTALEPGVLDSKHYVRGIGEVSEAALKGPKESFVLVAVRRR
jgi:hypothetical protein